MEKVRGYTLLFGASVLMVLGYCVNLIVDYCQYNATFNSAPFGVWILVDGLIWLVPAALAFAAGLISKKKIKNKEKRV